MSQEKVQVKERENTKNSFNNSDATKKVKGHRLRQPFVLTNVEKIPNLVRSDRIKSADRTHTHTDIRVQM